VLLVIIAAAAFLCTLCGGLLALRLRDKLHLILGFSAGAVIGVAFFDLLPEALGFGAQSHTAGAILSWTAAGFLLYLVLDRVLSFHGDMATRGRFAAGVLCVHSLLDGVAIGVAFQASHSIGITVAIAVLTHDFSDGINAMNVVLKNRGGRNQGLRWLLLDATAPVIGIAATHFIQIPAASFGAGLALLAGFFLYIGASDLIPESYHAHPKFLTTGMTLAGAAALYAATTLVGR
jgi:ZIP family zinc transporter